MSPRRGLAGRHHRHLAPLNHDVTGEDVDGGVDRVSGLGAGSHRVDVDVRRHRGCRAWSSGTRRHRRCRRRHRRRRPAISRWTGVNVGIRSPSGATRRRRRGGWAGGGDGGEVRDEAEVGGDPVEDRLRRSRGVVGGEHVRFMSRSSAFDRPWPFPAREATHAAVGVASPQWSKPRCLETTAFGDLLRYWRRVRAMSQLDLAAAAATTPRYMSFVETGRSQPSREMVLRLAVALDVPCAIATASWWPQDSPRSTPEHDLDHPAIEQVMAALDRMLEHHAPYPAVVMDRRWDVVRVNAGAVRLFAGLCAPGADARPGQRPAAHARTRSRPRRRHELGRGRTLLARAGPPRSRRRCDGR